MTIRSLLFAAAFAGTLSAPALANAGSDHKVFRPAIKTAGHDFYGVSIQSERCMLAVKTYYSAPKDKYDGKNVFRFRVKVELAPGGTIFTRTFSNSLAGSRTNYYSQSTHRAGCWAGNEFKIKNVSVVSCSGKRCKLPKWSSVPAGALSRRSVSKHQ